MLTYVRGIFSGHCNKLLKHINLFGLVNDLLCRTSAEEEETLEYLLCENFDLQFTITQLTMDFVSKLIASHL